jgi:hypothetical protein
VFGESRTASKTGGFGSGPPQNLKEPSRWGNRQSEELGVPGEGNEFGAPKGTEETAKV